MSKVGVGAKFARLTVTKRLHSKRYGKSTAWYWECACECGNRTEVLAWNLTAGKVKSCGCLSVDMVRARSTTHGGSETPEFEVWLGIRSRCFNEGDTYFARYGGRGITMCDRWRDDFAAFLADMGKRPSPSHSIERKDNDGHYEPGNCMWANAKQQARNRSSTLRVTIGEETKSLAEWAEQFGQPYARVLQRIRKRGWSPLDALQAPSKRPDIRPRWQES